jgi:hypothetical protein
MIRIERHPSRSQLIVFGLIWLVFFSFWGTSAWWGTGVNLAAVLFWSIAIVIPAAGIIFPKILSTVYVIAAYITFPIGWIISSVVLIAVYYLVLTPIGLVLRLAGYDPMKRHFDRTAKTYWLDRNPDTEMERYFKQF